jgi:hypothetical protein
MKYEPQVGDILARGEHPAIHIRKVTAATVVVESTEGEKPTPRALFDSLFEKTAAQGVIITRNGAEIVNTVSPPETAGVSGSHNTHARLAPSSSKNWTLCTAAPAYVEANKHRAVDSGGKYADEGTKAHDFAADVLLGNITPEKVHDDFREPVMAYVNHCRSLVPDGDYYVEVEVPLFYQRDKTGTCDFGYVSDERVVVRDYKHGAGVLVSSHENPQLAIYAMGFILQMEGLYDFTDDTLIDLKVVQPRHHQAEQDEAWVLPLSEFRKFCDDIQEKAKIAQSAVEMVWKELKAGEHDYHPEDILGLPFHGAVFAPSDGDEGACRWCKAKSFCGVRHAEITQDSATAFALEVMPDLTKEELKAPVDERIEHYLLGHTVSTEQLVAIFKNKDRIRKFLGDVEEYVQSLAATTPIPGLKWVEGRQGNRAWANEEAADTFLRGQKLKQEERYTYKLKSPTQIEALLKDKLKTTRTKNRFEELVTRSDGKPVLVPEEDKRQGLPSPGDVMPDVSEEDL